MGESYSERDPAGGAAARGAAPGGSFISEPSTASPRAREVLAQLLPGADADLLLAGLLAEGRAPAGDSTSPATPVSELDAPARELQRVRAQFLRGESARLAQHALSNPLTALLAEAQLLELEPLAPEHQQAVSRLIELARRVTAAVRRLDGPPPASGGGG